MLAGFKTKDLAQDLQVSIRQIRRWRAKGYLECVSGRITEDSFEKFCRNHPEKIPYERLSADMQRWLDGFGYQHGDGYRVDEVARLFRVSPKTVRRWITLNWLQTRNRRIPGDSLARLSRLHPEVLMVNDLSSEARAFLMGLGVRSNEREKDPDAAGFSARATSECA
jgi:hypothetical protein